MREQGEKSNLFPGGTAKGSRLVLFSPLIKDLSCPTDSIKPSTSPLPQCLSSSTASLSPPCRFPPTGGSTTKDGGEWKRCRPRTENTSEGVDEEPERSANGGSGRTDKKRRGWVNRINAGGSSRATAAPSHNPTALRVNLPNGGKKGNFSTLSKLTPPPSFCLRFQLLTSCLPP